MVRASEAAHNLRRDQILGFEVVIPRSIGAREISSIRFLPRLMGWRYYPKSNGQVPWCRCKTCVGGQIKGRRIRDFSRDFTKRLHFEEVKRRIKDESNASKPSSLLWHLHGKTRKTDPSFLANIIEMDDFALLKDLAVTLSYFRHPESRRICC